MSEGWGWGRWRWADCLWGRPTLRLPVWAQNKSQWALSPPFNLLKRGVSLKVKVGRAGGCAGSFPPLLPPAPFPPPPPRPTSEPH